MSRIGRSLSVAVVFALVGVLTSTVTAGAATGTSNGSNLVPHGSSADLGAALAPDGTFRGASGVAGTVDPGAWTLVSDPAEGQVPRFAPAVGSRQASIVGPWSGLGSDGSGDGALNSWVNAIAVSGSDLYVGGAFTHAGGVTGANFIAKWDGVRWSTVGAPRALNGQVQALAISGANLYVGGRFTNAGGTPAADYIARWNGHAWSALGSNGSGNGALNNWVHALVINGSSVDVGGAFTNAGGTPTADYLASWDGSGWSGLGSDGAGGGAIAPSSLAPSPTVFALAVSGSDLFVGGSFIDVAGIPEADAIARWDGSSWFSMGSGDVNTGSGAVDGAVYALAVLGSDLFAGGAFANVGTLAGDSVAKWDGTAWSALGSDGSQDGAIKNGNVYALATDGSDLYVGGDFYDAAGLPAGDRIARWDGAGWNAMGSGGPDGGALTGAVNALAVSPSNSDLIVGGYFWDTAGIATADQVALWGPPVVVRRPDGRVRLGTGAYRGDNVYNTTGAGQTRTGSAPYGHSISFGVSIQNDGTDPDLFLVKATGAAESGYRVRYFSGSTNITKAVVAGTFKTATVATGSSALITAKVNVKSTAASGSSVTRLVTLTSVSDGARKDAVAFVVKRS